MTKLTGAALDQAVANAIGLKSVHNCEKWGTNMTRKTLEQIWSEGAQKLFKQGANMTEEDEAFNDIERQAKQRKEAVKAAINKDKPMNNSPAFPVSFKWGRELSQYNGMTLRDYFAAKAMQGMMVDVEQPRCDYIARTAYEMADAMLKAREA